MSKSIAYIINDSEISAGTRGASLGPAAMRVADDNSNSFLFSRYPISYVKTVNHLLDEPSPYKYAKRANGLVQVYENVSRLVCEKRKKYDFTFVVAADHGSAGGTIAGLKMANPNQRIGILWIDAHADMHTPYTTPSGNMHGMPIATALNEDNLASQINNPNEEVIGYWNELKNIGGIAPKIKYEDVGCIAFRDLEQPEIDLMERNNIKNITVDELREIGIPKVLERLEEKYADCDEIYVSFDVDSMDPDVVSHGTGTPVDHGITPDEAQEILQYYAAHSKVKCIEFVEVNPCLDEKTNTMAETAYALMKDVIETVEKKIN